MLLHVRQVSGFLPVVPSPPPWRGLDTETRCSAAMSLRRPLLLRWSAYNDECLELLGSAPDALPSDKWLCHLIRIQHIAEDVGFQFSMDDPASVISLTDTKTQYHLKAFERQLGEWRQHATMDIPQRKPPIRPL